MAVPPDRLANKLAQAGATTTSAGVIILDSQRMVQAFTHSLEEIERLVAVLTAASHALKSYAFGNPAPDIARQVAALADAAIAQATGKSEAELTEDEIARRVALLMQAIAAFPDPTSR